MNSSLNAPGNYLRRQLAEIKAEKPETDGQLINVAGVGSVVSSAYEQLRNAAEYTQQHLLRQGAIKRFYSRNLSFSRSREINKSLAEELVIELTQAGYIKNNTLPYDILEKIQSLITHHYHTFWRMIEARARQGDAQNITLDLLSVGTEMIISDGRKQKAYLQFVFQHYKDTISQHSFENANVSDTDFDICLYIAIHKSLLKSDLANARFDMLQVYQFPTTDIHAYIHFFKNVDKYFAHPLTNELTQYINKYGAPLRILKSMVDKNPDTAELLQSNKRFLSAYESRIDAEYRAAKHKINQGIVKSIAFLIITKGLVSLAVEIPYDLLTLGMIAMLPLTINVLTPIIFMLLVRLGLKMPGKSNTDALVDYAQNMLYAREQPKTLRAKIKKTKYSAGFTIMYALMFIVVFGAVIVQLANWQFNIVQGVIFFIFLATASFLGFRLTHIVRDLELVSTKQGMLAAVRDFLFLPFILLGRWMSETYQQINITALILDTIVELPLKTILRLMRQWTNFIGEKKDTI